MKKQTEFAKYMFDLAESYDAKVGPDSNIIFKSEEDMTAAADDIADKYAFDLDFDKLELQFLNESMSLRFIMEAAQSTDTSILDVCNKLGGLYEKEKQRIAQAITQIETDNMINEAEDFKFIIGSTDLKQTKYLLDDVEISAKYDKQGDAVYVTVTSAKDLKFVLKMLELAKIPAGHNSGTINESCALRIPSSAYCNPWLTHKIDTSPGIKGYEFGNAFNDNIVNASFNGVAKAVYVNNANKVQTSMAIPKFISESGEISSDEQFKEYANVVLKQAHGDNFDSSIASKTVEDLLSKYGNNYGAAIGALTSNFG